MPRQAQFVGKPILMRLTAEDDARLDALIGSTPLPINRAALARLCFVRGLAELERETGGERRKGKLAPPGTPRRRATDKARAAVVDGLRHQKAPGRTKPGR